MSNFLSVLGMAGMTNGNLHEPGCRLRNCHLVAGIALMGCLSLAVTTAAESVSDTFPSVHVATASEFNKEAVFWYRSPKNCISPNAMLLLIPGCNGDGRGMLNESRPWAKFADELHLVLVGPTFKTTLEEVHSRQGYYYPELWSGGATLKALKEIQARTGVKNGKVFLFGFSAGAHFVHRFALWKPEKVAAFVAYSAGWWDAPKETLRNTPGLIMCGEADERFEPTYAFFTQGRRMGLPLIWRGYTGVGHEMKPQIIKMTQAFLGFYARGAMAQNMVGDIQSYHFYLPGSPEAQQIPAETKITLPSREVAEVWQQEQ